MKNFPKVKSCVGLTGIIALIAVGAVVMKKKVHRPPNPLYHEVVLELETQVDVSRICDGPDAIYITSRGVTSVKDSYACKMDKK